MLYYGVTTVHQQCSSRCSIQGNLQSVTSAEREFIRSIPGIGLLMERLFEASDTLLNQSRFCRALPYEFEKKKQKNREKIRKQRESKSQTKWSIVQLGLSLMDSACWSIETERMWSIPPFGSRNPSNPISDRINSLFSWGLTVLDGREWFPVSENVL